MKRSDAGRRSGGGAPGPLVPNIFLAALVVCVVGQSCPAPDSSTDGALSPDAGGEGAVPADSTWRDAIDPKLRSKIFDEVHAYLTAEDAGTSPPLLAKLEGEYRDVPFSIFEEAVRARPAKASFPATGLHQGTYKSPFYGGTETYHAYVPAKLAAAKADRFPLVVFLHGAGGNGSSVASDANVQAAVDLLGAIFVAPTCNTKCDWSASEDCMSQVVHLVQHLKRRYPVDDDRVVLSGFSMGGRGSFSTGVAYPEPYAGVVPVAGSIGAIYNTTDLATHKAYCCPHIENTLNLRLQYISGDQDHPALIAQNRGCELCLKEQKSKGIYTEQKGVGHAWLIDPWKKAVAWALAKPRARYPLTVVFNQAAQASSLYTGGMWPQTTLKVPQYWADIESREDTAQKARLEAKITFAGATDAGAADSAGDAGPPAGPGTINLTGSNVAQVTVYFSSELLDGLDGSPLRITSGTKVLFQLHPKLDRRLLLTEARKRSERSMTFAAKLSVSLATAKDAQ